MPCDQNDQTEVIRFLDSGAGIASEVKRIDTHGAIVFLIEETALKMKRAVKYDYMDLTTLEKRRTLLERELELNRRAAPSIYRKVVPVTRDAHGAFALDGDGDGDVVEWVLSMRRFPSDAELTHIAQDQGISDALAQNLGISIARYHRDAPVKNLDGATLIKEILDELDRVLGTMKQTFQTDADRFIERGRATMTAQTETLQARSRDGFVRRCHGDLHLRNIVMLDGVPTPFDALEFDERLGTCDTLYDLAFLLMDLLHRDFDHPANLVLNTYLTEVSGDLSDAGLKVLPLYLSIRSAIRAMVHVQTAAVSMDGNQNEMLQNACDYLRQALVYLDPAAPVLVAIGGLSGTGKTTIARAIAHRIGAAPGAIHIRSDVVRKKLMNVDPLEQLGSEGYSSEVTAQTYEVIRHQATHVLKQDHAAILDAVHANAEDRAAAGRVAQAIGCQFVGIWLETSTATRRERVMNRGPDASDADVEVVARQARTDPGPLDWQRINADRPMETVIAEIATLLA